VRSLILAFRPDIPVLAALVIQDKTTVFAVIAGFLLMLMGVGLVFRRFSKDTSDYFRAGGKATWWLLGSSMFMQGFSAWTFTGAAGAAFQAGWSMSFMLFSNVLIFVSFAAITGAWFRQLRCVTGADVIRLRFGAGMEQFIAYLGMLMGPIFGGVQLYGLAIFTSILLGVNINQTIVLLGFVVLFYSALSGAWAVLAADFIQALVLMPISFLLAVLCLHEMGGVGGLLAALDHAGLSAAYAPIKTPEVLATMKGVDPNWFTLTFFIAWYANNLLNSNSLNGGSCPRFLSAKDGREARRAAWLGSGLFLVGLFIWFIPPMTARLLIADEVMAMPLPKPVEGAYAAISIHFPPPGLVGLVLVGMCAATMSSLDSGLTSLAGNITQNIYPAACRALKVIPLEGRARLIFGKLVNLSCALVIMSCVLIMARWGQGGIFKILLDVMGTIVPPFAVPMVLSLFLRRVPPVVPFVSIGAGLAVSLSIYLAPLLSDAKPWTFQGQVGTVAAVSLIAFLLVRVWRRPDEATLAREREFFSRRDRPVDFATETGTGNDGRQLRIVGTVLGLAVLLLLIPASSAGHAGKILAVALSTLALGGLMIWLGRNADRTGDRAR
jgi:SSS family solute:Na+ symporter